MLEFSNVFYKNKDAYKDDKIKYIVNQGGTSSTKTYSTLQILTILSIKYPLKIDIVGLSVPHLKSGVLNDMETICRSMGFEFHDYYKEGDKVFRKGLGTINFLAFDKLGKAHGGRRDILYMNEANHLNWAIAEQLMIRTRIKVFIDYNPTNVFWVQKQLQVNEPERVRLIKSTYKDNPFLEQSIIDAIESRRGDGNNNFWRVYGCGELGIAEGLVFNNFEQKEFDINRFDKYRNGIDWGFSNDPFAFVRVAKENKDLYICREIYSRGLLNKDSAPMVKNIIGTEIVTCDNSEPKSVSDYLQLGVKAVSAVKGKGSIESGIKFLQSFEHIYIHPSCTNVYDEFCNYQWRLDKNGEALPEPVDAFNHAIDAIRYALESDMAHNKVTAITSLWG
ncbi:MAG: terminase large subunit [Alphaproteobacteria bacterium]|nr:terminase large subunit [Alphaproteobacteria bacterium]